MCTYFYNGDGKAKGLCLCVSPCIPDSYHTSVDCFCHCSFMIGQPLHLTLYIRPRFDEDEVEAVGNLIEDGEVVPELGESDDESYM